MAQTAALAASGASASSDTLGQHMSDSTITAKVKAQLLSEKDVQSTGIHVTTHRGVVSLTGKVPSEEQKERIQQVTAAVTGVKSVKNHLTVTAAETDADHH